MKTSNTSKRLNEYMISKKLRQVDLLKLAEPYCKQYGVKLNKSDLSQYVSGKVEPGQDKLFVLAKALKVTEAWLMGYDNDIKDDTAYYLDTTPNDKPMTREERERAIESIHKTLDKSIKSISEEYSNYLKNYLNSEKFNSIFKSIEPLLKELDDITIQNNADDINILSHYFNILNHEGHKEILKRAIELSRIEKYTKKDNK